MRQSLSPICIQALAFPDNSFDADFTHVVVEHLQDPFAPLCELLRALKPIGLKA